MDNPLRRILEDKGSAIYSVEPHASVSAATAEMNRHGVGAVLILNRQGQPVGIFTERDILRRVVGPGLDPQTTPVSDVMTRELLVVRPTVTVAQAMAIVTEKHVRHLPVVENERVVGVISSGDLTRWASRGQEVQIQQLVDFITGKYPG
jgi:CBS domain-containing protein